VLLLYQDGSIFTNRAFVDKFEYVIFR